MEKLSNLITNRTPLMHASCALCLIFAIFWPCSHTYLTSNLVGRLNTFHQDSILSRLKSNDPDFWLFAFSIYFWTAEIDDYCVTFFHTVLNIYGKKLHELIGCPTLVRRPHFLLSFNDLFFTKGMESHHELPEKTNARETSFFTQPCCVVGWFEFVFRPLYLLPFDSFTYHFFPNEIVKFQHFHFFNFFLIIFFLLLN